MHNHVGGFSGPGHYAAQICCLNRSALLLATLRVVFAVEEVVGCDGSCLNAVLLLMLQGAAGRSHFRLLALFHKSSVDAVVLLLMWRDLIHAKISRAPSTPVHVYIID